MHGSIPSRALDANIFFTGLFLLLLHLFVFIVIDDDTVQDYKICGNSVLHRKVIKIVIQNLLIFDIFFFFFFLLFFLGCKYIIL